MCNRRHALSQLPFFVPPITLLLTLLILPASALVDDRAIAINTSADIAAKRQALIQFIWGSDGFPTANSPTVTKSVSQIENGRITDFNNLERVDQLQFDMASWTGDPGCSGVPANAGEHGLAYHFIPKHKNSRLVIVHHGHACTLNDGRLTGSADYGIHRTINALLLEGYSVLAVYMPHNKPNDCGSTCTHDWMFGHINTIGSPMRFFLEPLAVFLNYLQAKSGKDEFPAYKDFNMVGLSGGGWTTTVYAAIDPRIKISFPVAGTVPLYLRANGYSHGDKEQWLDSFYTIAGYPDLYILGSYGPGRRQIQILNRKDDCCFGEPGYQPQQNWEPDIRAYEKRVREALVNLRSGFFRLEIDETAPSHMISSNAIVNVILPELSGGRR
jgi:hypothetical protein